MPTGIHCGPSCRSRQRKKLRTNGIFNLVPGSARKKNRGVTAECGSVVAILFHLSWWKQGYSGFNYVLPCFKSEWAPTHVLGVAVTRSRPINNPWNEFSIGVDARMIGDFLSDAYVSPILWFLLWSPHNRIAMLRWTSKTINTGGA